eukprot:771320-Pyramimonas_sp.AAC.1
MQGGRCHAEDVLVTRVGRRGAEGPPLCPRRCRSGYRLERWACWMLGSAYGASVVLERNVV